MSKYQINHNLQNLNRGVYCRKYEPLCISLFAVGEVTQATDLLYYFNTEGSKMHCTYFLPHIPISKLSLCENSFTPKNFAEKLGYFNFST